MRTGLGCFGYVLLIPVAFVAVGLVCWVIFNDQVIQ